MSPHERHQVFVRRAGKRTHIRPERVSEITEEVGYWRKANQVHRWFVEEVQEGVDDCKEYYASREKLQELLSLCERVIAASRLVPGKVQNGAVFEGGAWQPIMAEGKTIEDPSVAKELLPTMEGFFFGSTDYDEGYLRSVVDTRDMLKAALAETEEGHFYYQSSW